MLRRVFYDSAFSHFAFANFELRFDESDNAARSGQQRNDGGHNPGRGNESDVDSREIELFVKVFRFEVAGVDAFSRVDSRIFSQCPVELIMAYIDGDYAARAVLQKAISESAGRCADVEAVESSYIDVEMTEGRFQFQTAAADISRCGIVTTF